MSESDAARLLTPRQFRISASADRALMALTFRTPDEAPSTVVLPVAGAAALHLKITRCLASLGVRAVPVQAGEPVP